MGSELEDDEQILRSQINNKEYVMYPDIYFKMMDKDVSIACYVECDCGYVGFIRKLYPFSGKYRNIDEIKLFLNDFKDTALRLKKNKKFIKGSKIMQMKIIEDVSNNGSIYVANKIN